MSGVKFFNNVSVDGSHTVTGVVSSVSASFTQIQLIGSGGATSTIQHGQSNINNLSSTAAAIDALTAANITANSLVVSGIKGISAINGNIDVTTGQILSGGVDLANIFIAGSPGDIGVRELSGLDDVNISSDFSYKKVLAYDTSTQRWINKDPAALSTVGYFLSTGGYQVAAGRPNISGNLTVTSSISAPALSGTFYGDGSKLGGITTGVSSINNLTGAITNVAFTVSANNFTQGLTGTKGTFTTSLSSPAVSATYLYGDGSQLTGITTGVASVNGLTGALVGVLSSNGGTVSAGDLIISNSKFLVSDYIKSTSSGTPLRVNADLILNGQLSALSGATFVNTTFATTSALAISADLNAGPAFVVRANGSGDIASFYDSDKNVEVLHVGGFNSIDSPYVGINTSFPNKSLTVSGEISASSHMWVGGDLNVGGANINTLYAAKVATDAAVTKVNNASATWDNAYNTVNSTSASWAGGNSAYSTVSNTSASWTGGNSAYTAVNSSSAKWNTAYDQLSSGKLSAANGGFTVNVSLSTPAMTADTGVFSTSISAGSFLSGGKNLTEIFTSSLSTLTDVALSSLSNGQVLKYNSTSGKWTNGEDIQGAGATTALGQLNTDVTLNNPQSGQALVYDSAGSMWRNTNLGVANVAGLQNALDGKQPTGSYASSVHQHTFTDLTNFNVVSPTSAQALMYDGTSKWANTSIAISHIGGLQTALDNKQISGNYAAASHTHTASQITDFDSSVQNKVLSLTGTYIAPVVGGKIPATYVPLSVSDIVNVSTYDVLTANNFPLSALTTAMYVTTAVTPNKIYRWSGAAYVEISPSPGSTDDVPELANPTNKYFTSGRAIAAVSAASNAGGLANQLIAPAMDGVSSVGTSVFYSRADHVHPTDTSRAPLASPGFTGTPTTPTPSNSDNTQQIANTTWTRANFLNSQNIQNNAGALSGVSLAAATSVTAPSASFTVNVSAAKYLGSGATLTGVVTSVYGQAVTDGNITNLIKTINNTSPTNGNFDGVAVVGSANSFTGSNTFLTLSAKSLSGETVTITSSVSAPSARFTNLTATSGFFTGGLSATKYYGDGSALSGVATSVTGVLYTSGGTVTADGLKTPYLSAQTISATNYQLLPSTLNNQTGTTYTIQTTDNGKVVTLSSLSAITVTIPTGLPIGYSCSFARLGVGLVTFTTASTATTINSLNGYKSITDQYGGASVLVYASESVLLNGSIGYP